MDTTGTITSFSATPQTYLTIGGDRYYVQTPGKSYSLTNPDPQTLQFSIQPGDHAWFDGSSVDRSEIMWAGTAGSTTTQYIPPGTPIAIDYQFAVQPNGPNNTFVNNAWFFVTAEMHDGGTVAGTSPPFAVQLNGDHLQLVALYVLPGGNPAQGSPDLHYQVLWTDPNPIVPGHYYDINIQANVSNSGGGYLKLAVDGKQVVNYSGPLGYGSQTYWEEGLYRNAGPTESVTADFRSLTMVTGSQAIGWTGVGGSPTTPTTPPNVAPTVTQASASPGTGIEHAGDTITLTLGFSEAVTVTGTPTLKLNDGNTATYVGGSGTGTLTFHTTVASTDTNTSALAITGVNLPSGASIKDASGLAANLSGAVKTFTGLQIDPISPAVTQATATPGTGTEHVGDTITLSLAFNEAVTVTGTPTLSLNDGGKATYVGGSGTGTLTFKTTVASTDTSTSALAITGVNLPSGTAIKDASGIAANLSAAVKTFSGLAVSTASTTPTSPTTPTTPTAPTTPSATKPVLTVADHSLWVAGRGGSVDLGTKVTTTDSNDHVTVNITGLPRYETITDKLDGQTFRGNNITLTAAQVDSGLELHSYYRGGGHPTATLTLTASAKDPTTGAVATASPQTITVVDPRPTTTTTTTTSSHHHHTATDHQPVATTTAAAPTTSHTTESTDHQHTASASTGSLANQGFALLQQHFDPAASTLATTAAHPTIPAFHPAATGTTMASFASQSFALLNQYLAAHTGHVDPGQIVAALSHATGLGTDSLLARPQH
ncbi:polysaccharide lyase [Bradyrhizobium xenonodulans]|uniref:Polysaccharide lyase n=1 Tax=Bradyrhizobium xenonodulans TaxID=2736875 RepID=A0ABY7MSS5_9BRAD|nr:heparin lyase I family protein [Bradyrhizobium xenonodulans]WBL81458.1 polysaccharide lyase [Bradyrhizobium xenonodulans]